MPTALCRILGRHQPATTADFMGKWRWILPSFYPGIVLAVWQSSVDLLRHCIFCMRKEFQLAFFGCEP
jgi:uncharacterized protein (DUF2236 family)